MKIQYLLATQGEMFCDLPQPLPLGLLYLAASLPHPLHLVVPPDRSGQQGCSRLDPTMSYL